MLTFLAAKAVVKVKGGVMSHYTGWRILQIIPPQPGWKAVHGQQTEDKKIEVFTRPIIC